MSYSDAIISAPLLGSKPVRFTMLFIVLPGGGNVVFFLQNTLRDKIDINVMAQLREY